MKILVALGGNALLKPDEEPTYEIQYRNAVRTISLILDGLGEDDDIIFTHGNGTQVGVTLYRYLSSKEFKPYPLFSAVSETQGFIGDILSSAIYNVSKGSRIPLTVITHVVVDKNDPAFNEPSKPIGPAYSYDEVIELFEKYPDWKFKNYDVGWRRVVPSPEPVDIIEKAIIKKLFEDGYTVIACGGGGIPVVRDGKGVKGIDAVIDKDKASSLLARFLKVDRFVILTNVDYVYLNYGEPDMTPIKEIGVDELRNIFNEYEFEAGSIKPKIEAVLDFVEYSGGEAVISSLSRAGEAIKGRYGTIVRP